MARTFLGSEKTAVLFWGVSNGTYFFGFVKNGGTFWGIVMLLVHPKGALTNTCDRDTPRTFLGLKFRVGVLFWV